MGSMVAIYEWQNNLDTGKRCMETIRLITRFANLVIALHSCSFP